MPFWVKLSLVGALIAALVGWHVFDKQMAVRASTQALEASYVLSLANQTIEAKNIENTLKDETITAIGKKNEEIKALNDKGCYSHSQLAATYQ